MASMAAVCNSSSIAHYLAGPRRASLQLRSRVAFSSRKVTSRRPMLVAMSGGPFEKIADRLGDEVYADLNGWRLYLRDMKADGGKTMAQVVAERVGSGDGVEAAMQDITIKLGGGRKEVTLADIVPENVIKRAAEGVKDLDD